MHTDLQDVAAWRHHWELPVQRVRSGLAGSRNLLLPRPCEGPLHGSELGLVAGEGHNGDLSRQVHAGNRNEGPSVSGPAVALLRLGHESVQDQSGAHNRGRVAHPLRMCEYCRPLITCWLSVRCVGNVIEWVGVTGEVRFLRLLLPAMLLASGCTSTPTPVVSAPAKASSPNAPAMPRLYLRLAPRIAVAGT